MNMHFQLQIKHNASKTDKQTADSTQAARRQIIHDQEIKGKKKENRKGGISCSPDRSDAAKKKIHV